MSDIVKFGEVEYEIYPDEGGYVWETVDCFESSDVVFDTFEGAKADAEAHALRTTLAASDG